MSIFEVADDLRELPGKVRGLTPELAAGADQAVADGRIRRAPNTPETVNALAAVNRYLSKSGFRVKSSLEGSTILWAAVPKKARNYVMTPEHRAKIVAARTRKGNVKATTKAS